MTRQTWTAFVSAGLFVTFAVLLAVLPVPFVAWGPGGTENTLGTVKDQPIISVAGTPTHPTTGRLDLTIVSGTAADSRLTLPEALAGYWLPNRDTLPRDSVYPPGQSADEVERAETQMMDSSQSDAVVSALRAAGQPVTKMPAVASVTVGGPAHNRLLPGDLIQSVDGVATVSNESVGRQIRTHRPREVIEFSVLRDKVPKQVSVTSVESGTQEGAAFVGITVGDGYDTPRPSASTSASSWAAPVRASCSRWPSTTRSRPGICCAICTSPGTGQISPDGQVGAIGGLQQKVASAADAGALDADDVLIAFATQADGLAAVVDGGRVPGGRASTVVDLTVTPARVIRDGPMAVTSSRPGRAGSLIGPSAGHVD